MDMLTEIFNHIKKDQKFEYYNEYTSCLDESPELIAIIKWYYFEKLEWCGCGRPGDGMRAIAKYLESRSLTYPENDKKLEEYFPYEDDSIVLCLAYELDRAGFTEHGSSIYGCWLTTDGEYFLWAIQEAEKQDILDI